ncbi:hypothetical protein JTB14_023575 [Gonioctena quinquepunctata]|nr:hypothetical protein JTB14_023575 [Gonioctena quinquepunctata]
MHADSLDKSTNVYSCQVRKKHISFAKLGNEEDEHCECMRLHGHREDSLLLDTCDICRSWKVHIDFSKESRDLNRQQAVANIITDKYFSTDFEKNIMLPGLDTYKKVVSRDLQYTIKALSLRKKNSEETVIWHEGISGRDQYQLVPLMPF